jgi:hypothetical protein
MVALLAGFVGFLFGVVVGVLGMFVWAWVSEPEVEP